MNDERLQRIEDAVNEIKRGMFGEKKLNFPGIISTQEDHGRRISRLERAGIYLASAGGVLGIAYKIAVDWWPHR